MSKLSLITLTLLAAISLLPCNGAEPEYPSYAELRQNMLTPVVQHETESGIIACRNPQFPFERDAWNSRDKFLREHMLVDLITSKVLLHKDKSYVDDLFAINAVRAGEITRYSIWTYWVKCGSSPSLNVDVIYDQSNKVARHRASYTPDCGMTTLIDSKCIE